MKRRRLFVAAGSLAVVSAAVLVICFWSRKEPVWNGKTCSQWFAEFRRAKVRHRQLSVFQEFVPVISNGRIRLVLSTNYFEDIDGLLADPAADALRALGTNIIPVLTKEIRHKDPKWLPIYVKMFAKLPGSIQHIAPNPPKSRDEIRGDAALALTLLRADAAPAWPTIFEALIASPPYARYRFMDSLHRIPVDTEVLDTALNTLVRRGDLLEAVSMMGQFGAWGPNSMRILTNAILSTNLTAGERALSQLRYHRRFAPLVVPALRAALTNSNQGYCLAVVDVLESYECDASDALPELVEMLKSGDNELRYRAARAIENLGTNALPAIPALLAARNDQSEMVQRVVVRSLNNLTNRINP